jgi:hypothetical protein
MKQTNKKIKVVPTTSLYKWAKNFKRVQDRFWKNQYKLRRIQQIEDFAILNGFDRVYLDNDVHFELAVPQVSSPELSNLIVITNQGYSRYPLSGIINQINRWLDQCPDLYLCLNRHYLNINNQKIDLDLPKEFLPAITSWLNQSLDNCIVTDLSRNYTDRGGHFTWVIPDRHYYIKRL